MESHVDIRLILIQPEGTIGVSSLYYYGYIVFVKTRSMNESLQERRRQAQ